MPCPKRQLAGVEAPYVLKEISNYLVCSTNDLRSCAQNNHRKAGQAREQLERLIDSLPLRERLAVVAIVSRDLFVAMEAMNVAGLIHLSDKLQPASVVSAIETPPVQAALEFDEWLFE